MTETETETREFNPTYAAARPLALEVLRAAVADYRTAVRRVAAAEARYEADAANPDEPYGDPADEQAEWDLWLETLDAFARDAENRLIGALLLNARRIEHAADVREAACDPGWEPVAMDLDQVLYVVAPKGAPDWHARLLEVAHEGHDSQDCGNGTWSTDAPLLPADEPEPEPDDEPAARTATRADVDKAVAEAVAADRLERARADVTARLASMFDARAALRADGGATPLVDKVIGENLAAAAERWGAPR